MALSPGAAGGSPGREEVSVRMMTSFSYSRLYVTPHEARPPAPHSLQSLTASRASPPEPFRHQAARDVDPAHPSRRIGLVHIVHHDCILILESFSSEEQAAVFPASQLGYFRRRQNGWNLNQASNLLNTCRVFLGALTLRRTLALTLPCGGGATCWSCTVEGISGG